jgi:hypothetical protein
VIPAPIGRCIADGRSPRELLWRTKSWLAMWWAESIVGRPAPQESAGRVFASQLIAEGARLSPSADEEIYFAAYLTVQKLSDSIPWEPKPIPRQPSSWKDRYEL